MKILICFLTCVQLYIFVPFFGLFPPFSFFLYHMSSFVSYVLNSAEKIPVVGSPIGQASNWYFKSNNEKVCTPDQPPPSYEKAISNSPSTLSQISDYVWKKASFSSSSSDHHEVIDTVKEDDENECMLDKSQLEEGISLIKMATEVNNHDMKNQEISINLYMMGLDKILASLPSESLFTLYLLHLTNNIKSGF